MFPKKLVGVYKAPSRTLYDRDIYIILGVRDGGFRNSSNDLASCAFLDPYSFVDCWISHERNFYFKEI